MKKTDEELMWQRIHSEQIVKDQWMDFSRARYRFPDGTEFEPYYRYSRRSYAVIAAEDTEGRFLCVRQFRPGIEKVTVEFPAGGIETGGDSEYEAAQGGAAGESILEAAKRELLEETGYVSDNWQHLLSVPSNATIADNDAHLFYARDCRRVSDLHLDDTEYLEPEVLSEEEIKACIADGSFAQAIHILTWLLIGKQLT